MSTHTTSANLPAPRSSGPVRNAGGRTLSRSRSNMSLNGANPVPIPPPKSILPTLAPAPLLLAPRATGPYAFPHPEHGMMMMGTGTGVGAGVGGGMRSLRSVASMPSLPATPNPHAHQPMPVPMGMGLGLGVGMSLGGEQVDTTVFQQQGFTTTDDGSYTLTFHGPGMAKPRRKTSKDQFSRLEETFRACPKPDGTTRRDLAIELGMPVRAIQVWFQNRRAKAKIQDLKSQASSSFSPSPSLSEASKGSSEAMSTTPPKSLSYSPTPFLSLMQDAGSTEGVGWLDDLARSLNDPEVAAAIRTYGGEMNLTPPSNSQSPALPPIIGVGEWSTGSLLGREDGMTDLLTDEMFASFCDPTGMGGYPVKEEEHSAQSRILRKTASTPSFCPPRSIHRAERANEADWNRF